jgi:hypothetical protein
MNALIYCQSANSQHARRTHRLLPFRSAHLVAWLGCKSMTQKLGPAVVLLLYAAGCGFHEVSD